MAIVTIMSSNPDLSFCLQKNPATQFESGKPFSKDLRKGRVYGWFLNQEARGFRMWFKDHPTETSFNDAEGMGEFEYLDTTRYASPLLPPSMIHALLNTASTKPVKQDVYGHVTSVMVVIKTPNLRTLEAMAQQYRATGEVDVNYQPVGSNPYYNRIVVTAHTVARALNVMTILCLMQALSDSTTYVRMDISGLKRFIKAMNLSDAPYYPRYLLASRAITDRGTFDKVKAELETPTISLRFGDTQMQRWDAIKRELKSGERLVDLGCGEMFYTIRKANDYKEVIAVDMDEEQQVRNARRLAKRNVENVVPVSAIITAEEIENNGAWFENADVLMSEVMEHNTEAEADAILKAVLDANPNKVVVTVPNFAFNKHYCMGEAEFRHPDHIWEPTFEEWCDYAVTVAAEKGWQVTTTPVGDIVEDCSVSIMSVFTKG